MREANLTAERSIRQQAARHKLAEEAELLPGGARARRVADIAARSRREGGQP